MATIDKYKIQIDVDGESKVKSLTKSLDGLGTTLAGIGFGAFIANAFRMADAMNDIADATGLTAGYVKGLGTALQQAGGNMDDVGTIVNKFSQNVDDLANGSDKAADAFGKLGIKGKDLLTLSRQDVLGLTLQRLSEMGPSAERTALGIELFGKAFGKIDPKKLDEILKTQDFAKLDAEVRKAGEAYGAMEDNILALQQAVLATFAPLIGDMQNMRLSAEQAEKVIKTIALTFALAFGAKTVLNIIEVTKAIRQMAIVSNLLGKNPVLKLLAGGALAVGVGAAIDKLMEAESVSLPEVGGTSTPAETAAAASKVEATQREKAAKAAALQTEQQRKQIELATKYRAILIENIGLAQDQLDAIKQDNAAVEQFQNDILNIQTQIANEQAKGREGNQGLIDQLFEQLKLKQEQVATTLILNSQERERLQLLEKQKQAIDEFYNVYDRVSEIQKNTNNALIMGERIAGELTEEGAAKKQKLFDLEQQWLSKDRAIRKEIALAELANDTDKIARLKQQQVDLELLYETQKIGLEEAFELQQKLNNSMKAGAVDAMKSLKDSMTPYKLAQDAILMTWNKISSYVDSFITDGKFKFKDFARSILEDLAKMIAKALIFKYIFEPIMGGLGLKIPGLAEGGPVKGGQPYIVGEKGPELFVPPTAGKIVPNNQLQGGGGRSMSASAGPITNNYNTYNISALDAKSVAQLFAENRKAVFGANKMAEREMMYAGVR